MLLKTEVPIQVEGDFNKLQRKFDILALWLQLKFYDDPGFPRSIVEDNAQSKNGMEEFEAECDEEIPGSLCHYDRCKDRLDDFIAEFLMSRRNYTTVEGEHYTKPCFVNIKRLDCPTGSEIEEILNLCTTESAGLVTSKNDTEGCKINCAVVECEEDKEADSFGIDEEIVHTNEEDRHFAKIVLKMDDDGHYNLNNTNNVVNSIGDDSCLQSPQPPSSYSPSSVPPNYITGVSGCSKAATTELSPHTTTTSGMSGTFSTPSGQKSFVTRTSNIETHPIRKSHPIASGIEAESGLRTGDEPHPYGFEITAVLHGVTKVADIIENLVTGRKKFVTREDRGAIVALLVDSLFEKLGPYPSKYAVEMLAKDLVKKYPELGNPFEIDGGYDMYYYYNRSLDRPSGLLQDRIQNQRKDLVKKKDKPTQECFIQSDKWMEQEDPPNTQIITNADLLYMKSNDTEASLSLMNITVFSRRCYIKNNSFEKISEEMPRLFDKPGQIIRDFDSWYPKLSGKLYDTWPIFSEGLLTYFGECGFNLKKKIGISMSATSMSEEQRYIAALVILPYIIPSSSKKMDHILGESNASHLEPEFSHECDNSPRGHSTTSSCALDANGKTARVRKQPSTCIEQAEILKTGRKRHKIEENTQHLDNAKKPKMTFESARESLIIFEPNIENVKSILAANNRRHPFIVVLGSMEYLSVVSIPDFPKYYVIITKFAVPCSSFLQALDTCFKSFWLFQLEYPVPSMGVWCFIEHGVFRRAYRKGQLPSNVKSLAVQMRRYYMQYLEDTRIPNMGSVPLF